MKPICNEPRFDDFTNYLVSRKDLTQTPVVISEEKNCLEAVAAAPSAQQEVQLEFEEQLPQKQVMRLNEFLSKELILKNHVNPEFTLSINLIEFWKRLKSTFDNKPYLIGSFVGHLYDIEQTFNDIDFVNPITKVFVVDKIDPEAIYSYVINRSNEVRNQIEDIIIDLYQESYPTQKRPDRREIWNMFFGAQVRINELINPELDTYGSRFSLLRLGALEIKTVYDFVIIKREPVTIKGIEKLCAFSKDGLRITLDGILEEGRATSSNTKIVSIAGPISEAVKCLRVRELITGDADGGKFVKWLDYVTWKNYFCSPKLALEIFANCLSKFTPEKLLARIDRYFDAQQKADQPIGILSCLINMATLCDSLSLSAPSIDIGEKAVTLRKALNEFAQNYVSRKSQGYLKQNPELIPHYLDFCKLLLLIVPTVKLTKKEMALTFRELIAYEEKTYSLITLDNSLQFFTQFLRTWTSLPYSLNDLYRGVLLQVRLKGDAAPINDSTCMALFIDAMSQFLIQRRDLKKLALFNHCITLLAPQHKISKVNEKIIWSVDDLKLLFELTGISSLETLPEEEIRNLFTRALNGNDSVMDYFALILSKHLESNSYKLDILKCLPRALEITHNKDELLEIVPEIYLESFSSTGMICAGILAQCPREMQFDLWSHYLDNNLFESHLLAIRAGCEISHVREHSIAVWNKVALRSEFNSYPVDRGLIYTEYMKCFDENPKDLALSILENPCHLQEALESPRNHLPIFSFFDELLKKAKSLKDFETLSALLQCIPQECKVKLLAYYSRFLTDLLALPNETITIEKIYQLSESIFSEVIKYPGIEGHQALILNYLSTLSGNNAFLQRALTLMIQSGVGASDYTQILDGLYDLLNKMVENFKNPLVLNRNLSFIESFLNWAPFDLKTHLSISSKFLSVKSENLIRAAYKLLEACPKNQIPLTLSLELVERLLFEFDTFQSLYGKDPIAKAYDFYYKAVMKLSALDFEQRMLPEIEQKKIVLLISGIITGWTHLPSKSSTVEVASLILNLIDRIDPRLKIEFISGSILSTNKETLSIAVNLFKKIFMDNPDCSSVITLQLYNKIFRNPKLSPQIAYETCRHLFEIKSLTAKELTEAFLIMLKKIHEEEPSLLVLCSTLLLAHPDHEQILAEIISINPLDFVTIVENVDDKPELYDAYSLMLKVATEFYAKSSLATYPSALLVIGKLREKIEQSSDKLYQICERQMSTNTLVNLLVAYKNLMDKESLIYILGKVFDSFKSNLEFNLKFIYNNYHCFIIDFFDSKVDLKTLISLEEILSTFISMPSHPLLSRELIGNCSSLAGAICVYEPQLLPKVFESIQKGCSHNILDTRIKSFVQYIDRLADKEYLLPASLVNQVLNYISLHITKSMSTVEESSLIELMNSLKKIVLYHSPACFESYFKLLISIYPHVKTYIISQLIEIAQIACLRKDCTSLTFTLIKQLMQIYPEGEKEISRIKAQLTITLRKTSELEVDVQCVTTFRDCMNVILNGLLNKYLHFKLENEKPKLKYLNQVHEALITLIQYGKLPSPYDKFQFLIQELAQAVAEFIGEYKEKENNTRLQKKLFQTVFDVTRKMLIEVPLDFEFNFLGKGTGAYTGDNYMLCLENFKCIVGSINHWLEKNFPLIPPLDSDEDNDSTTPIDTSEIYSALTGIMSMFGGINLRLQ